MNTDHFLLRRAAEDRLKSGTAPSTGASGNNSDALSVLYRLSSDPARASEALKLLHELQVHQVELDLQREEIERNRDDAAIEMKHYQTLFDFAPVPYFVVTLHGQIIQANRAAAKALGIERNELAGRLMEKLLDARTRTAVDLLLNQLSVHDAGLTCKALVSLADGDGASWQLLACVLPESDAVLMALVSAGDRDTSGILCFAPVA